MSSLESVFVSCITSISDQMDRKVDISSRNLGMKSNGEASKSFVSQEEAYPVFLDEITLCNDLGKGGTDDCGIIPNACLPFITTSVPSSVEKRGSLSSGTPSSRKKAAPRHSFKLREENPNSPLCKCSLCNW